jgi:hypothetical protein
VQVIHNGAADLTTLPRAGRAAPQRRRAEPHINRMAPNKNIDALLRWLRRG